MSLTASARVTGHAWDALEEANDPPRLFRHGGLLVRLEAGEDGSRILQPLSVDRLRYEVARAADWFKMTKAGAVPAKPLRDVVSDMLADPNPRLPVLDGSSRCQYSCRTVSYTRHRDISARDVCTTRPNLASIPLG